MIKIIKFKKIHTVEAAKLISNTFAKFNNKEGDKKAISWYINIYNPKNNLEKIKTVFFKSEIFYIATHKDKVVGIIRGNKNRVVNLFVNGRYHKKGIGKKLLLKFENECKKKSSKKINIRASLYAVKFYKKQGYKKTTGTRNMKGINVQPMIKIL